jgi:small subunit ribosomal protein S17
MSETITTAKRAIRKERSGVVSSSKMDKTIVVKVHRKARHPRYKKVIDITKKYYVHDESNQAKEGDSVVISETRPTSKLKRWRLVKITRVAE